MHVSVFVMVSFSPPPQDKATVLLPADFIIIINLTLSSDCSFKPKDLYTGGCSLDINIFHKQV